MKLQVVSIYDIVSQVFGPLLLFRSINEAKRSFQDACSRPDVMEHPEDLKLMQLGTFDDNSGVVDQLSHHILICSGEKRGDKSNVLQSIESPSTSYDL